MDSKDHCILCTLLDGLSIFDKIANDNESAASQSLSVNGPQEY